ncbi:PD40 domain-containing protein [Croceivirga thetidis]|uniref:Flagellar motor protein MotB n=1 Tax=Croceivirga thetidis TaxID=2721623 RepID=A0ABX1GV46_9FLAO|nr:PD40 domain-containing protein [Croceivirga thetidis]NKI32921.1 hypothetical protein [Croceivirga thetidis]
MSLKKTFIFILLLATGAVAAQKSKTEASNQSFDDYSFASAVDGYEELLKKGYDDAEIYRKLGDANFFNSNYVFAAKWYRGLSFAVKGELLDPETIFRYALSLKSLGRYEESDEQMLRLRDTLPNDLRVRKFLNQRDYLKVIKETSGRYQIEELDINSEGSEFAPCFHQEGIVFSSTRSLENENPKNIHGWTKMPFLDLFQSVKNEADSLLIKPLDSVFNSEVHESSITFSKDGNTAYFTRNNFKNGEFVRDSLGVSRLKIYKAIRKDGIWQKAEDLPFNDNGFSTANPVLSPDEKKLFFVSDMPGSFGRSDIFYVTINEDGTYGSPVNLGPEINTNGRETFPFLTESGHLYFASDGHPGLGGLDIYVSKQNGNGNYLVKNIGDPVNSSADDFALIFSEVTKKGYFSSNREGGEGSDDIYMFTELKPLTIN